MVTKCGKWTDQHETSMEQRKNLSPQQESIPWQPEHWAGTFSFVPRSCYVDQFTFHISWFATLSHTTIILHFKWGMPVSSKGVTRRKISTPYAWWGWRLWFDCVLWNIYWSITLPGIKHGPLDLESKALVVSLKWYYDQIFIPWFFYCITEFHERMKTLFTVCKYLH